MDGGAGVSASVGSLLRMLCELLTGDFDNTEQVSALDATAAAGGAPRAHPYAKHVTRVINGRIANLPANLASGEGGVFLLEESDYVHPPVETGGPSIKEAKPLLLFLEPRDGSIWLSSYQFAKEAYEGGPRPGVLRPDAAEAMRNASVDLALDYATISPSPTFSPAKYSYDEKAKTFHLNTTIELGGEMRFMLQESLSSQGLSVMEVRYANSLSLPCPVVFALLTAVGLTPISQLLSKNGHPLTRHTSPIEYRRVQSAEKKRP